MTYDQEIQIWLGIVTIAAVIVGPILALYIQSRVNIRREKRDRKLWVFRTLMATRNTRVAADHVIALNMIDLEFYGNEKNNKEVTRAWNLYRDHLNNSPDNKDPKYEEKVEIWNKESNRVFNILLDKLGKSVGYDFEELLLNKGGYSPKAHGDLENELFLVRVGLIRLLGGDGHLKMDVTSFPAMNAEDVAAQKKLRDLSIEYFEGKSTIPVKIVDNARE
jgi:hypothetical protein